MTVDVKVELRLLSTSKSPTSRNYDVSCVESYLSSPKEVCY